MIVRQSVYARLCGVKPPSISELIKRGLIIKTPDGKIDLDNPVNAAYLSRHGGQVPAPQITPPPPAATDTASSPPGKPPRRAAPHQDAAPTAPSSKPEKSAKRKQSAADLALAAIRAGQAAADDDALDDGTAPQGGDFSESELQDILRRALYESRKIKNEAELKAVQLDIKHGNLIEREVVESIILQLAQAIQQDFVGCIPKQALQICARFGMVGHEAEVEDVLTGDNDKRLRRIFGLVSEMVNAKYIQAVTEKAEATESASEEES